MQNMDSNTQVYVSSTYINLRFLSVCKYNHGMDNRFCQSQMTQCETLASTATSPAVRNPDRPKDDKAVMSRGTRRRSSGRYTAVQLTNDFQFNLS